MTQVMPENVADAFQNFLTVYQDFRICNNLSGKKQNAFEICTAMMDKCGRIARQVKHFERNDPKQDWPDGLSEAATGLLIYMIMLMDNYDLDIDKGMLNELQSAVKQYSNKDK